MSHIGSHCKSNVKGVTAILFESKSLLEKILNTIYTNLFTVFNSLRKNPVFVTDSISISS